MVNGQWSMVNSQDSFGMPEKEVMMTMTMTMPI